MRIPNRYSPIVFGALLSAIMVAVVSAIVLAINQGDSAGISLAMAQKLRHDLAGGIPYRDRRGALGAAGRCSPDRLVAFASRARRPG